jgi:hypothetical protein
MPKTLLIFVESLYQHPQFPVYHQTRLDQLKPYLYDPNYRVLIYSMGYSAEFNNKIFSGLQAIGTRPEQFFAFIAEKPLTLADEIMNARFLQNKADLLRNRDKSDVIVLGLPSMQSLWVQEAGFSLLEWPYQSTKSLTQLMEEQLQLTNNEFDVPSSYYSIHSPHFFPNHQLNKRSVIPSTVPPSPASHCEKEFQGLLESMRLLRSEMGNLTGSTLSLEEEQITLQRQLLQSALGQTELLQELYEHKKRATADWILGSILIGLHIPGIVKGTWKSLHWFILLVQYVHQRFSVAQVARIETIALQDLVKTGEINVAMQVETDVQMYNFSGKLNKKVTRKSIAEQEYYEPVQDRESDKDKIVKHEKTKVAHSSGENREAKETEPLLHKVHSVASRPAL